MSRYGKHYDHTEVDPERFAMKPAGGTSYVIFEKDWPTNQIRFMWKDSTPSVTSGSIPLSTSEVRHLAKYYGLS